MSRETDNKAPGYFREQETPGIALTRVKPRASESTGKDNRVVQVMDKRSGNLGASTNQNGYAAHFNRRDCLLQLGVAIGSKFLGIPSATGLGSPEPTSLEAPTRRPKGPTQCFRQFNLDWSWIALRPDQIGEFFREASPAAIAEFLAGSFVDGTVVMAVPHHGYCTHNTRVGTRFPSLHFDWFGEMVDELHRRDISVFGYVTINWNWKYIREHLGQDYIHGQPDENGICGDRVMICLNAPGYLDLVQAYTEEVLRQYPVDGMRWDILKTPRGCSCVGCRTLYREIFGESWSRVWPLPPEVQDELHDRTIERVVRRLYRFCKAIRPDVEVWQNHLSPYSLNPLHLAREMDIAYNEFGDPFRLLLLQGVSKHSAVINGLMNQAPDNPPQALDRRQWRVCLALGGRCYSYYGHRFTDPATLLPNDIFRRWHREQLAPFYRMVREIQSWLEDAQPFTDIAVLFCDRTRLRWPKRDRNPYLKMLEPWVNLQIAASRPPAFVDVADLNSLLTSQKRWSLLIIPLTSGLTQEEVSILREYALAGGTILVIGDALRHDTHGKPLPDFALADDMGVQWRGEFQGETAFSVEGPLLPRFGQVPSPTGPIVDAEVTAGNTLLWAVATGTRRLPLLHVRNLGRGRIAWLAAVLPGRLVFQIVEYLAGPPPIKVTEPAEGLALLAHQRSTGRWILHLITEGKLEIQVDAKRVPIRGIETLYPPQGWEVLLRVQGDRTYLTATEGRTDRLIVFRSSEVS